MNTNGVVGLNSSRTAVLFSKGYGGRHANERLPIRQIKFPTSMIERAGVNPHFGGALDTLREDHDGMTTLTMFFQTEIAAAKFEQELLSCSVVGGKTAGGDQHELR